MPNTFSRLLHPGGFVRQAVFTLTAFLVLKTIGGFCYIPSGSMEPTLHKGDVVYANRLAYGLTLPVLNRLMTTWATPEAGDVIIFHVPGYFDANESLYIKRVVAVQGDVVEVRDNRVFVNGAAVPIQRNGARIWENLGRQHEVKLGHGSLDHTRPMRVPPGHVYVLGDHRNNSADSRAWGPLPLERVRGKAVGVAVSLDMDHWKAGTRL